jgi:hypothetical protein
MIQFIVSGVSPKVVHKPTLETPVAVTLPAIVKESVVSLPQQTNSPPENPLIAPSEYKTGSSPALLKLVSIAWHPTLPGAPAQLVVPPKAATASAKPTASRHNVRIIGSPRTLESSLRRRPTKINSIIGLVLGQHFSGLRTKPILRKPLKVLSD